MPGKKSAPTKREVSPGDSVHTHPNGENYITAPPLKDGGGEP